MLSHAEKHPDRSTYLGSGDIASIFGCEDAFGTPFSVAAAKKEKAVKEMSEAMTVGLLLENYVLDRYQKEENEKIAAKQVFIRHPDYEFCGATVDGLIINPVGLPVRIVEAKTTRDWSWDAVPLSYEAQVQWQMGISGIKEADLTVLHRPDLKLRTYRLPFDQAVFEALLDKAVDFWHRYILGDETPPVDGGFATTETLKAIKASEGKVVEIDQLKDRFIALKHIQNERKALEEKEEFIKNEIRAALGDAEVGLIDGNQAVTWKQTNAQRLDTKRLKTEAADVYEKFLTRTETRTLLIKGIK